jgi:hypothetical protein
MKKNLVIAISVLVFVLACQSVAPLPTSTPQPTETLIPTSTSTPIPTKTSIPPTPTIEPPSVLSNYLTDVRIDKIDNFDTASGWHTYNSQTGKLSGGVYTVTGQPGWMSGLVRNAKFTEGQGVMFEFKYDRKTEFEFILDKGEWQTDSYRRFGVFGFGYPQANLTQGKNAIGYGNLNGNFRPQPDVWYNYMAGIGFEGNFIALIWDTSDPSKVIIYKEGIGEKWDNLSWEFTAKAANSGMNLYIDNFAEISFSAIK